MVLEQGVGKVFAPKKFNFDLYKFGAIVMGVTTISNSISSGSLAPVFLFLLVLLLVLPIQVINPDC